MSENYLLIEAPIYVMIPRKTKADRKVALNLNTTRNLHYHVHNQVKQMYKEIIKEILDTTDQSHVKFTKPVRVVFQLHKASRRRSDKHNVLAVVEKMLMDALTDLGVLVDDNDDWIKEELFLETKVDKDDPRVTVYITEIEEI